MLLVDYKNVIIMRYCQVVSAAQYIFPPLSPQQGTLISNFMDKPGGALQKNLAKIGIEVILDMVHACMILQ